MQSLWNCLGRATLVWVSAVVLSVGDSPGEEPGGLVGEVNKLKATVAELKKEVGTLEQTAQKLHQTVVAQDARLQTLQQTVVTHDAKLGKTGVCIYADEGSLVLSQESGGVDPSTKLRKHTFFVPSNVPGNILDAWYVPLDNLSNLGLISTITVRPGADNRSVDVCWSNVACSLRLRICVLLVHPGVPVTRETLWSGEDGFGRVFRNTKSVSQSLSQP